MTGSAKGYEKRRQTMEKKYGKEGYEEKKREWASKGGKNSPGFSGMTPEKRKEAGRKGWEAMIKGVKEDK